MARYPDWIRPYLENQKADIERSNSYTYFKAKHDTILESLKLFEQFEEKCRKFLLEDEEKFKKVKAEGGYAGSEENWLVDKNGDVLEHYPP